MSEPRLLIVAWHYVRDRAGIPHPGIHPVTLDEFREQVARLGETLHIISPERAEAWANGEALDRDSLLITFDDGLVDHFHAAREVLDPLGLQAAFFVPTLPFAENRGLAVHLVHWLRAYTEPERFRSEFIAALPDRARASFNRPKTEWETAAAETYQFDRPADRLLKYLINFVLDPVEVSSACEAMLAARGESPVAFRERTYLSDRQVRQLIENGHLVGCHGHSHVPFSRLAGEGEAGEMRACLGTLNNWPGARRDWAAYPYGSDWSLPADPESFGGRWGLRFGLTYRRGWNDRSVPPILWRRIDVNEIPEYLSCVPERL